ncbi:hypothetical protein VSH64_28920 [Amycolatopsis rhabdoformis]|uniref:Phage holin family protein n=1 Tax=Amycolatopsis rhabdoformis TaxID=1448059 RepID=A0ABZ1HXM8_9PSEU|nr:hypothetical protein [Amycolatopsis rhabdoformis]WSE26892.1 hypothetical protein VSH64_28920 [Amycolatopsis rhabdoformis]
MTNPGDYGPPKGLGQARIFMWIQVAFNVLGSIFLLLAAGALASTSAADDTGTAGLLVVILVVNIVMAVLLAVCAIQLRSGKQWPWITAIVVEAIVVINGIVTMISSGFTGVLPIVFAALALSGLLHKDVRAWIAAQRGPATAV